MHNFHSIYLPFHLSNYFSFILHFSLCNKRFDMLTIFPLKYIKKTISFSDNVSTYTCLCETILIEIPWVYRNDSFPSFDS